MKKNIFLIGLTMLITFLVACGGQKRASFEDSGAGVIAEQRRLIQKNINDPGKQTKLLRIVTEVEKQSNDFFRVYETYNKNIVRLNKEFKTSRQEFEKLNDEFNRQNENYLRMLVEKRGEMKALATKDEWINIMARESSFIPE